MFLIKLCILLKLDIVAPIGTIKNQSGLDVTGIMWYRDGTMYDENPFMKIELFSSTTELLSNTNKETVYFYAKSNQDVPFISLIDSKTSQIIATMYDDGNFYSSGDGIYSTKYYIIQILQ